jgi:hypothetical protein
MKMSKGSAPGRLAARAALVSVLLLFSSAAPASFGAAANAPKLPWFFNAMNPAVNTNAVPIMFIGDSTMDSSQSAVMSGIYAAISQYMAWGGGLGDCSACPTGSSWGTTLSFGVAFNVYPDTNWFQQYYTLQSGQSLTNGLWNGYNFQPQTNADTITVAYTAGPNSGIFQVFQLPAYGGPGKALRTINTSNATYRGCVTNIPLSPPTNVLVSVVCVSGQVNILAEGALTRNQHGFQFFNFSYGGKQELQWTNVNTNVFIPIMRALNPAVVIFQGKNNSPAQLAAGYSNFIAFWSNALPQADQIHLGTYAVSNALDPGETNTLAQNAQVQYWAGQANRLYIDLLHLLPDPATLTALNWYIDGIHLKPSAVREGGIVWNAMLGSLQGVNLFDTNFFQGTAAQGALLLDVPVAARWKMNTVASINGGLPDSVNGNNLTPMNLPAANGACDFNGASSYAFLNSPALSPPVTISAWVCVSNSSSYAAIIGEGTGGLCLYVNPSQQLDLRIVGGADVAYSAGTVSNNIAAFCHVALTWDGTNYAFYINGAAAGSGANATSFSYGGTTYIGADNAATGNWFNGAMKDMIIFRGVLAPAEVKRLYQLGPQ